MEALACPPFCLPRLLPLLGLSMAAAPSLPFHHTTVALTLPKSGRLDDVFLIRPCLGHLEGASLAFYLNSPGEAVPTLQQLLRVVLRLEEGNRQCIVSISTQMYVSTISTCSSVVLSPTPVAALSVTGCVYCYFRCVLVHANRPP